MQAAFLHKLLSVILNGIRFVRQKEWDGCEMLGELLISRNEAVKWKVLFSLYVTSCSLSLLYLEFFIFLREK